MKSVYKRKSKLLVKKLTHPNSDHIDVQLRWLNTWIRIHEDNVLDRLIGVIVVICLLSGFAIDLFYYLVLMCSVCLGLIVYLLYKYKE